MLLRKLLYFIDNLLSQRTDFYFWQKYFLYKIPKCWINSTSMLMNEFLAYRKVTKILMVKKTPQKQMRFIEIPSPSPVAHLHSLS